jgi:hypothetical protein
MHTLRARLVKSSRGFTRLFRLYSSALLALLRLRAHVVTQQDAGSAPATAPNVDSGLSRTRNWS